MSIRYSVKVLSVVALVGFLCGCGRVLPYENPEGMTTITMTFQNLAHLNDSERRRHLDVAVFRDDFQCRGRREVVDTTPEVTIQAELRTYYTILYRVGTFVQTDPTTYTDRCSGMYTFPLMPYNEYRVQFDEKEGLCYFRVLRSSIGAGPEWKNVDELFSRKKTVPFWSMDGPWCDENGLFKASMMEVP